jgi:predicted ATP-grasp superfamily ATP-dependent carboligase
MAALGLQYAGSPQTLLERYPLKTQVSDPHFDFSRPLVQEFVPGRIHDVCALFNRGRPKAVLTQKRLLMYPERGGRGIECETTDEPELKEKAISLLRELEWHGPAQVEFKRDSRDGVFKLMEVNPRFWGTLELSIRAGIPFPQLACRMLVDDDITTASTYQVGLRFRWLVPYLLPRLLHSKHRLGLLVDLVRTRDQIPNEIRFSDPLPHLVHPIYLLLGRLRRSNRELRHSN